MPEAWNLESAGHMPRYIPTTTFVFTLHRATSLTFCSCRRLHRIRRQLSHGIASPTRSHLQRERITNECASWLRRTIRLTMSSTATPRTRRSACKQTSIGLLLTCHSVGLALADTLDDLISSRRIEPQLAMRVLQNFDQSIASVLGEKVKARMNFKVRICLRSAGIGQGRGLGENGGRHKRAAADLSSYRVILTLTGSATRFGRSLSRMLSSSLIISILSKPSA